MSNESAQLLARIEELERRLVQLEAGPKKQAPWGACALGTLITGLLVFAMAAPAWVIAQDEKKDAQELTVKKLTVVDAGGKPRVVLSFDKEGGLIRVLNTKDKDIAILDNDAIGGTMRLFGNNEKRLLVIGANKDGCQINACDPEGKIRAYLGVDAAKEGYVSLRNVADKTILICGADDDGGLVRAFGADGKQRAFFGVGAKQGDGLIMLYGVDGKRRHWIGSEDDTTSHIVYGKDAVLQHEIRGGKNGAFHTMMSKDGANIITTVGASTDSGEGILRLNTTGGKSHSYLGSNKNGTGGLLLLNTPQDSSRVVLGIDANGVGFGEGRDADNVIRRSMK